MSNNDQVQQNSKLSKIYWMVVLSLSAFSIWLRAGFPLTAMPVYQHDDLLFVRLAHYLAAGQWLGPYDNLTLAKGMFYPMFIAAAFWTSVPLKIAEQIVYLVACLVTAGLARRFAGNGLGVLLFAALAFNPVSWDFALARVLRQGVYFSLSLAVVTLVVIIAHPYPGQAGRSVLRTVLLGISLGLVGAAYWLTREEGVWLLPAIAVVLAVAFLGIFRPNRSPVSDGSVSPGLSSKLKAIAVPLAIALVAFTSADWVVAGLNYRQYGIFETNEFRAKSFLRAYGALSRIKHDHWRYLITFPQDVRLRAYAVSPAARELSPFLEGPTRDRWLQITCFYGTIKPCDEVQTGFDMWELRDAVADAGHYKSGADAMRFYDTLADQIDAACGAKTIPCLPPRATMQPPFRRDYLKLTPSAAKQITRVVFKMVDGPVGSSPSAGTTSDIAIFADTIDDVYMPENATIALHGWVAAASATPSLRVENRAGAPFQSSITANPAPDVDRVYPSLHSSRFELKTDCPISNCDLILDVTGFGQSKIPLEKLVHPGPIPTIGQTTALMGYIDDVRGTDAFTLRDRRRSLQLEIANRIASVYAFLFPKLAGVAALGLLLATFFRRRFPLPSQLLALGLGSAIAVATFVALMAYVKATSNFNVTNVLYTSPSSPFVIAFTVIGIYSWLVAYQSQRETLRRKRLSSVRTLQHITLA
jgi:hypothetical protein